MKFGPAVVQQVVEEHRGCLHKTGLLWCHGIYYNDTLKNSS
jgi:hypothetical protein